MNPPRPTHVYIVDDSPSIRARLTEMIGHMPGLEVVGEASSAPHAILDILTLRPDSVLLDLNLQGSNGMRVMHAIHPQAPEITFVVLTNHAESQYRRACERAGASYFLDKSTEFERVPLVLAEIAAHRH